MHELYQNAHPESLSWDWSGVIAACQTGKAAMCVNYGDFAVAAENLERSIAAMKRSSEMPGALTYPSIMKAIEPPHVVPGPKIPKWNEYSVLQCDELSKCVAGKQGPHETAMLLKKKLDQLHGV